MTDMTPLDRAHAAMEAAPRDDAARLAFFGALANAELFLLLADEARGDTLDPQVFDTSEGQFVLVFDTEARLAGFAGDVAHYAALPGRVIAGLLAGQDIGLGLNLEVAPSSMLLGPEALDWLNGTLAVSPQELSARATGFAAPRLPDRLITALDARFATMAGLAHAALLAGVRYDSGASGHVLVIVGALPAAEPALARAVAEALAFSGLEATSLDVVFQPAEAPVLARIAPVALRFDWPEPPRRDGPSAPGTDPTRPPRLR
jgi:hypothetical protein